MTEKKTRFDILYDARPGRERLTVKCNFPKFELGAMRTERVYFGPRAKIRYKHVLNLARLDSSHMDNWIIDKCGVGSRNFLIPKESQMAEPMAIPKVNDTLLNFGKMSDQYFGEIKLAIKMGV